MEELVKELAYLEHNLKEEQDANNQDGIVISLREAIADQEQELQLAKEALENEMKYSNETCDLIKSEIDAIKARIVDEWSGEKKTIKFDSGTVSLRITKSLTIVDGRRLLGHMVANMPIDRIADEYLKGFLLTPTKAYVTVHGLGEGIAKIDEKTTVKLEQEA